MSEGKLPIEVEDLSKRYEGSDRLAVDGLSMRVNAGEIYCLLGPNGAGKTTTINMLLGFLKPTRGIVRLFGMDVHKNPLEIKKYVAYVPENVNLYGDFSAVENLDYFARLAGRSLGLTELESVLHRLGLQKEVFSRRVKTFSKGMRQKLGLAIAVAKNAPVILMDEPTSGLDPMAVRDFIDVVDRLRDDGTRVTSQYTRYLLSQRDRLTRWYYEGC